MRFKFLPVVALTPMLAAGVLTEVPLSFEPNVGQADGSVRFLARTPAQTVFVTSSEVVLALHGQSHSSFLRISFPGAAEAEFEGLEPSTARSHYFLGKDPKRWKANVPGFRRVRGRGLYPGVDAILYGRGRRLEYDLVVAPGSDPAPIRLRFEGALSVEIDSSGDLVIETGAGVLRHHRPIAYQQAGRTRRAVEARYRIVGPGEIRFELGPHDPARGLVIDPLVTFSTFVGGSGLDEGRGVAVDAQGNVYVAGTTHSPDFPVTAGVLQGAYRSGQFPGDAFVLKLSPDGKSLLYSSFLGGARTDVALDVAVDTVGRAYVAGYTDSGDFPTTAGAFQPFNKSQVSFAEGFVAKLSPDGSALQYSTFLGGESTDRVNAIAIDSQGGAYVAGVSDSSSFPTTPSAFQATCPGLGFGAFAARLNPAGVALSYSTFLCGAANDEALDIAVDQQGNAYVAGATASVDFPTTPGAHRTSSAGDGDGFVAKVNSDGSGLVYSTYLGGSGPDEATGVAVDAGGRAHVAGFTRSTDLPATSGAAQPRHRDNGLSEDAFVAVLNSSGSALDYGSYFGGSGPDRAEAIAVDNAGAVYITGSTGSPDFPNTPVRCQTSYRGGRDAFLARFEAGGSLGYSLFLGGLQDDRALAVAVGPSGDAYVAGQTWSGNFTTTPGAFRDAYQPGYRGGSDAFVTRVGNAQPPPAPCIALNGLLSSASFLPGPVSPGEIVSIFGDGLGPADPVHFRLQGDLFPKEVAGTQVFFDGVPAPMILSWNSQVNTIVPYSVAGKDRTTVRVEYLGASTAQLTLPVAASAPAIFTSNTSGRGPGAILNEDLSPNSPQNPAAKGSVAVIYATGEGETQPAGVDGKVASDPLPHPLLRVLVTIGGLDAPVEYAGAAPTLVAGLIQINARIPKEVASGSAVPVVIKIGDKSSPSVVSLSIR